MVGASNKLKIGNSTPKTSRTREMTCTANNECPPISRSCRGRQAVYFQNFLPNSHQFVFDRISSIDALLWAEQYSRIRRGQSFAIYFAIRCHWQRRQPDKKRKGSCNPARWPLARCAGGHRIKSGFCRRRCRQPNVCFLRDLRARSEPRPECPAAAFRAALTSPSSTRNPRILTW